MGVSFEQYENTPALTIDWDLELAQVEKRVAEAKQAAANKRQR